MSSGQPTKLSTTKRSPFDAEMALREVPRSIPTWRISAILFVSFLRGRLCSFLDIGLLDIGASVSPNPFEECFSDGLPVLRCSQHRRFFFVRDTSDLGQDGRHVRGH